MGLVPFICLLKAKHHDGLSWAKRIRRDGADNQVDDFAGPAPDG